MIVSPKDKIGRARVTLGFDSTVSWQADSSARRLTRCVCLAAADTDHVILETAKRTELKMPGSCAFMNVSNTIAIKPFATKTLKIWFAWFV
jgi:hypothetical protein